MNNILILCRTGLLYKIMHKIIIYNPNAMIHVFGRLVHG